MRVRLDLLTYELARLGPREGHVFLRAVLFSWLFLPREEAGVLQPRQQPVPRGNILFLAGGIVVVDDHETVHGDVGDEAVTNCDRMVRASSAVSWNMILEL